MARAPMPTRVPRDCLTHFASSIVARPGMGREAAADATTSPHLAHATRRIL